MIININGAEIIFPYDYIYPEQYEFIYQMYECLNIGGSCILEMPSGTGKTVSLLSASISYILNNPNVYNKIVYCTRTVVEIEKVMEELKCYFDYYEKVKLKKLEMLAICLSARKNLCINEDIFTRNSEQLKNNYKKAGKIIDSMCYSFINKTYKTEGCKYYENINIEDSPLLKNGVYTLDDIKNVGINNTTCPYFLSRFSIQNCQILVYSYYYLLDPKVSQAVSKEISSNSIIIFDEAHNIDNICMESFTVKLNFSLLTDCKKSIHNLESFIRNIKQDNKEKLQEEYTKMLSSIKKRVDINNSDLYLSNPIIPSEFIEELIPGNVRKADHFISFLKRLIEFLFFKISSNEVIVETPFLFLKHLYEKVFIDHRSMRLCSERLKSLLETLDLTDNVEISSSLSILSDFATIISTYQNGFSLIIEPYEQSAPQVPNPTITLGCLDATIACKPIFERFKSVILTSGTLSPIGMYPKLLNFNPTKVISLSMSLVRPNFCPIIVTKGSDQSVISSRFSERQDISVVRNYGFLVIEVCKNVPDGIVCFFTSYRHLESCLATWQDMGIIGKIQKQKLIFCETANILETTLAIKAYKNACEIGRGSIMMSVSRGKVSEGVDFRDFYGRAVIILGVPYIYTQSYLIKSRLEYLKDRYNISESDFLTFDAIRFTAQCLGRVIRGKNDYGLMYLADDRFSKPNKIKKLPRWIQDYISVENIGLTVDEAINVTRKFLRQMGQPLNFESYLGVSLLTEKNVNEGYIEKLKDKYSNNM